MIDPKEIAPKCSECGAPMHDYEAVWKNEPNDYKTDVPDYARCNNCGAMHPIEE